MGSALASPRILQSSTNSLLPTTPHADLGRLILSPARTGDHVAIHQLLTNVFRGPSAAEFQAQQEEPGYSPAHRFVVRDGHRLVGHARVSFREMLIGSELLPVARVFDLCVLPEYRKQRLATNLLVACEQLAREQGAVLMQTRSARVTIFDRLGWFPCGRMSHCQVGPRELLAEIERRRYEQSLTHMPSDDLPQLARARHPLTVRRWKQTELTAVQRLYTEATVGLHGPLARSEAYWQWLIARQAYDWFYVAIDGPDRTLFDDIQGNIVGYIFMKGSRIVELMASPTHDRAAEALITRACRDANEQSITPLGLDIPTNHRLVELIAASGGKRVSRECDAGEIPLAKVLDLPRLTATTLREASAEARVTLQLRDEAATIPLHRDVSAAEPARLVLEGSHLHVDTNPARPQATCSAAVFAQLLLGHLSLPAALESNQLRLANRSIRESLEAILTPRTLWFPALDDLLT